MNSIFKFVFIACFAQIAYTEQQQQQLELQQQPHKISRRQTSQYNCVTPENYYGYCVQLGYCPQIVNVFQTQRQDVAQRYVISSQRACGTRSVNGDPVVCCTRPQRSPVQTTRQPVTQAPTNPFLPPATTRPTRVTQNPFLTTQRPVIAPTFAPTPRTARPTTTTIRTTAAPLVDNRGTSCQGPDTRPGSCIAIEQCQVLLNELRVRSTDEVFTNYLRASNRICGSVGSTVCCPGSAAPTTTPSPTRAPFTDAVPRRLPQVQEGCGYTTNSFKKIVGGEVSKIGAWPWATLLGYDDDLSSSPFKCGGALITARHVLTAAHCMRKDLSFVRLGEHDLTRTNEARHMDVKVVRSEPHPQYNRRNGRNDIAILYLERNVPFTDFISPICLPTTQELRSKDYKGYTPFVVGWGKTMEGGQSATVLQELQIPILPNQECRDRYAEQNRLVTQDQFDEGVICAGVMTGGKDTCQGDSGGPLMFPEPYGSSVRYYLIGVVSYGIGCARPNVPGVYTSTQYFIDWIATKVADTR